MSSILVQTEALVLRNLRFGDTSRVATLLTRDLGKIGVLGKGVRDPKSAFGASLEILSHSSFVLYHRPGRELQFLKSGWVEREFRGILREPARYLRGCACLEFLDRVLPEAEPASDLFALALRAMEVMETAPVASLPELFRAWQLRVASLLGYAPRVEVCAGCGRAWPEEARGPSWIFLTAEGGVACPECAAARRWTGIPLSSRALRRLRAMIHGGTGTGGPLPGAGAGQVREPSPLWLHTLDRLVEEFLRYHIGSYRGLRSLNDRDTWEAGRAGQGSRSGEKGTLDAGLRPE